MQPRRGGPPTSPKRMHGQKMRLEVVFAVEVETAEIGREERRSLNRGRGQANLSGITHVLEELMVLQLLLLLISYM